MFGVDVAQEALDVLQETYFLEADSIIGRFL
jgi:hypothetical protein